MTAAKRLLAICEEFQLTPHAELFDLAEEADTKLEALDKRLKGLEGCPIRCPGVCCCPIQRQSGLNKSSKGVIE